MATAKTQHLSIAYNEFLDFILANISSQAILDFKPSFMVVARTEELMENTKRGILVKQKRMNWKKSLNWIC